MRYKEARVGRLSLERNKIKKVLLICFVAEKKEEMTEKGGGSLPAMEG